MSLTLIKLILILFINVLLNGNQSADAVCEGTMNIRDNEGYIESPGYSEGQNYPTDVTCNWVIIGPTGSTVTIEFLGSFILEESKKCDMYDYVTIKQRCTGQSLSGNLGTDKVGYCGNLISLPKVNTTCNELHVTFHSDDSDVYKGFRAKYKINKDSEAPQITWLGSSSSETDLQATERDRFVFHCRVYGHPRPNRYWSRVGSGSLPADVIDDRNGTLTIPRLRYPNDAGQYMCIANNTWGEDRKLITLTVIPRCMCPKNITTNWYHDPPFVMKDKNDGHPHGIFPILLDRMISACCGNCSLSHGVSDIIYGAPKNALNDVKTAIVGTELVHMSFPVSGKKTDDEYKGEYYRPMFTSPGIAILVMTEDPSQSANAMLMSVISAWPVLVLTIIMAWLSGVVMWTLDTWYNPDEFPRPFHKGVFEGFWWAYVTMTTVGYGDRSPKSYGARLFAIVWVLVGLVIISITTGVITTSLTAITLSTDLKLYGAKMGAIENTTEYRLGVLKNSDVIGFTDVEKMIKTLENRKLDGVFLDSFVAGAYKSQFSSNIRVNKILDYDSYYGVVFRGKMGDIELRECFDNYVTRYSSEISEIIDEATTPVKEPKESASEEIASSLFDASTPMFRNAIFTCLGLLLFFSACGLIWDYGYRRHFRNQNTDLDNLAMMAGPGYEDVKYNMELLDSLMQEIQEFNDTWTERFESTIARHEAEYRQFSKTRAQKT